MRQAKNFVLAAISLAALHSAPAAHASTPEDNLKAKQMVAEILAACESQRQIPYLTKTYGSFSIEQAYAESSAE